MNTTSLEKRLEEKVSWRDSNESSRASSPRSSLAGSRPSSAGSRPSSPRPGSPREPRPDSRGSSASGSPRFEAFEKKASVTERLAAAAAKAGAPAAPMDKATPPPESPPPIAVAAAAAAEKEKEESPGEAHSKFCFVVDKIRHYHVLSPLPYPPLPSLPPCPPYIQLGARHASSNSPSPSNSTRSPVTTATAWVV